MATRTCTRGRGSCSATGSDVYFSDCFYFSPHRSSLLCSTSFDEHVFEIILPRVTTVGHVDLKFSFNDTVTTSPRIQVMLYQQKLAGFSASPGHAADVDWKIDFNLKSSSSGTVKPV